MLRQQALTTVVVAALTMFATSLSGAESVFQAIPTEALAFVAANRLAESDAKLQKLAQQVQAPAISVLALAKATSGVQKGLDEAGSAALVVMPGAGFKAQPVVVILVPVTDYQEFLKAWSPKKVEKITEVTIGAQSVVVGQRGSYAAIAEQDNRAVLEKLLDAKQVIGESQPQFTAWLAENDVLAVATNHGVKKVSRLVQEQLKQMKAIFAQFGDDTPANMKPAVTMLEMYAKVFQRAEKEVGIIGAAGKLDKDGTVRIATRTRFMPGSALAATLVSVKPLAVSPLTELPSGMFALAGGGAWSQALTEGFGDFQAKMLEQSLPGVDKKQVEEYAKLTIKNAVGVRSLSFLLGPGQPSQPLLSDSMVIYNIDDASRFLVDAEKQIQTLVEFTKKVEKPVGTYGLKKTEVAGHAGLEIEFEIKQTSDDMQAAVVKQQLERMVGDGGKMKMYLVALDEHRLAGSVGSTAPILRAIEALKKSETSQATDAEVQKTAALLPPGAQWTGFASPIGLIAFQKRLLEMVFPAGFPGPTIPDFPPSPPIGMAIKAVPDELQTEAVLPAAVIEAIGKYVSKVQGAQNPDVP